MISNYFHDVSVALLATNILAIYYLGRLLDKQKIEHQIIPHIFKRLSRITYAALTYIVLGGALRAYYFMDFEWHPAIGRGQITALVIKHVLLVSITAWGLYMQIKYVRKYGKA
jgi:hypothetical protein